MSNGSFSRAVPVADGGELKKVLGNIRGEPTDSKHDEELEDLMRYAERSGQYDPWKKED